MSCDPELVAMEQNAMAWVLFCNEMKPWLIKARDNPDVNKHIVVAKVLGVLYATRRASSTRPVGGCVRAGA